MNTATYMGHYLAFPFSGGGRGPRETSGGEVLPQMALSCSDITDAIISYRSAIITQAT